MLNKTFETTRQTISRYTAILEVDDTLKPWEIKNIEDVIELLKALEDENSVQHNPS